MTVSKAELERSLAALRQQIADPAVGLFGPGSLSWFVNRESGIFLAGGRAALLQLAHPYVASAIDQHSLTRDHPLARFRRTFRHVYAMVFGDLDHAIASARRVHAIHSRITGTVDHAVGPYQPETRYEGNDEEALFWVQATLLDSAIVAFELVVRPLTRSEKEAFYAEGRRFAALFGIPEAVMPPSYDDFVSYNQRMWDWLRVSPPASEMAGFLLAGAAPPILGPLARWYRAATASLLPPSIQRQYGLSGVSRLPRALDPRAIRPLYRRLPASVRFVPAYHDAERRLAGKPPSRAPIVRMSRRLLAG